MNMSPSHHRTPEQGHADAISRPPAATQAMTATITRR